MTSVRPFLPALALSLLGYVGCGGTVDEASRSPSTNGGGSGMGGSSAGGDTGTGGHVGSGTGGQTGRGTLGASCSLNSDCDAPLSCEFGRCHAGCAESRDCPAGSRCVAGPSGTTCQLEQESKCSYNSDCAYPLVCASDMQCRNQCGADRDCVKGQVCIGGVCGEAGDLPGTAVDAGPPCAQGAPCFTSNPCVVGIVACDVGGPICKATGNMPDGTACGTSQICMSGVCVSAPTGDAGTPAHAFQANVQPILDKRCAVLGCHTAAEPNTPPVNGLNLDDGAAYLNVVNVVALQGTKIGEPSLVRVSQSGVLEDSYVYRKITGNGPIFGNLQPPAGSPGGALTDAERSVLIAWLKAGALND